MVLGLLSTKPMTGYEIQHELQLYHADKWAGILSGSVYHALKKLEQENLIEINLIENTGNRTKASYKLSDKGHNEFLKLLKESLVQNSVVYPTTMYTALTFLDELPKQVVSEAIALQKSNLSNELESMKAGQRIKNEYYKMPAHVEAVFENIYAQIELQIDFLTQLEKLVEYR